MPIYEFYCGYCGRIVEDWFPTSRDVVLPSCQHGAALLPMERVPSCPRPHKLTGEDELRRRDRLIREHNNSYWQGKEGRERIREDTSGHYDVGKIADQLNARSGE